MAHRLKKFEQKKNEVEGFIEFSDGIPPHSSMSQVVTMEREVEKVRLFHSLEILNLDTNGDDDNIVTQVTAFMCNTTKDSFRLGVMNNSNKIILAKINYIYK